MDADTPHMDNVKITPPPHPGLGIAGQTVEWLPSDTKESFERLNQDPMHRAYFESKGWHLPGAITYKINSHGFRCDEIEIGKPYLVALGCSYTNGIGLPLEVIWPELVGKALGLKVANLSWGGSSSDTCYRLAEYWVPELKPKLVAMLAPPEDRMELLLDPPSVTHQRNIPVDVYMAGSLIPGAKEDNFVKHWFLNDENSKINQRKNIRAIKQLCAELNIPCIALTCMDFMSFSREEIEYARDAMHGGPEAHRRVANRILNDWNEAKHT